MANYFTLGYESTANTSPNNVELNYGSPYTDGLTVHAALYAGSGFTPTHYKMWGVKLAPSGQVVTASGAEWIAFTESRTVYLVDTSGQQYAYAKFKNASETETETFQSNPVTYSYTAPTINSSCTWEQSFSSLGYGTATSNTLKNDYANIEVEFSKNNIEQLSFSGRDFSGLRISENAIYIDPTSEIGKVLTLGDNDYVSISKVFSSDTIPFITVTISGVTSTLTSYDFSEKTTISGTDLSNRVGNVNWTPATKTLTWDTFRFSEYGFCTIQKVEFANNSQTGAYVGGTATFYVYVQDGNGEPVENAPVTVSGIAGSAIGTLQEGSSVTTNVNGIAEFNLDVTSEGFITYNAYVDSFSTDPDITIFGVEDTDHYRSLLTQYEQIYQTYNYSDTVSGVNTAAVAEPETPTVSGSSDSVLEHDLNVLRTLVKQIKGTTDWFSELPKSFDPTDTDAGDTENKDVNLTNIKNNTLDANTIILAISEDNSGAGFSLTPGDEGFLFSTTLNYATPTDRRGLPIYQSTTNSGTYYDEGGLDRVVGIDLIDTTTGSEFKDSNGNIIYGRFHDGADHSGTGDGTDVYVKFYTVSGTYTTVSGNPSSIMMIYPYRKTLSEMAEHEWLRTDFVSSWEGDSVIVDFISDLWSYTGASDGASNPNWTSISGSPLVDSTSLSLADAANAVNDGFGSRLYAEQNYITSSESITDSLDALDTNLYDLSQSVAGGTGDKYVVEVDADITAGTSYLLPFSISYTPDDTSGQEGSNMDIYVNGQLLAASTGTNGVNEDNDYSETDSTHVTFYSKIHKYSLITFVIRE